MLGDGVTILTDQLLQGVLRERLERPGNNLAPSKRAIGVTILPEVPSPVLYTHLLPSKTR